MKIRNQKKLYCHWINFISVVLLSLSSTFIYADESLKKYDLEKNEHKNNNSIKDNFNHKNFIDNIKVGFRVSSLIERRGVKLYDGLQIDPAIAVFLYDRKVEFLGESIGYRDFVAGDWLRLRGRLSRLSDQPLFPSKNEIKNQFQKREKTYEISARAEFFIPHFLEDYISEVDLSYFKDISAHRGNYLDLHTKIKLYDFRAFKNKTLIEPNFFASVGWGDSSHNQYLYGPSARRAGVSNISYGIWFLVPEKVDRFFPVIQIRHFQTLGRFRNTEYSKDKSSGWLMSMIFAVDLI